MGLADNRKQIEEIVRTVDEDGSGQIEFDEFLTIIKSGATSSGLMSAARKMRATSCHVSPRTTKRIFIDESEHPL